MISPSIDHWPFGMQEADVSLGIEQRFPFSRIRGQQRRSAQAQTRVSLSEADQTTLDIQVDAANAFLMLHERRAMEKILEEQRNLVMEIVAAVNARYRSGSANSTQADVIRAEVELARVDARLKSFRSETIASEAMLNASLGRPADLSVPELSYNMKNLDTIDSHSAIRIALSKRPEISTGQAQLERAAFEIAVMQSMYLPMITVQTGPAYTMAEGPGLMFMLGIGLPIWRQKLRAGVAEAEAMERMARADLDAMKRMVEGDAAAAYNRIEAARIQFAALEGDVLPRVRRNIEPSLSGYAAGLLPLVSVTEAIRMLLMTREELIEAEVFVGISWISLRRAIGTLEGSLDE